MGDILKIKNRYGVWEDVPAIFGANAYEIAVKNGYEGTEQEWLEGLKGEKGDSYILTSDDKSEIVDMTKDVLQSDLNNKIDKSAITTIVNGESTHYAIPTARAAFEHAENIYYLLHPRVTATENSINQINETIITKTNTVVPETLAVNTIYDLGEQTSLTLALPSGQLGDFIQVDFLSTATPTTLTITATSGLSDYDLIPEANTIYSLYFNWIRLDATTYGWGFDYAEYTRTVA